MKKAIFTLLIIFFLVNIPRKGAVNAQAQEECRASYSNNWMIIDCMPGFATNHDRLLMYQQTPFDQNLPWQENLDHTNATWIFDVGANDRANLVIQFHQGEMGLVADLYDDGDGDGQVSYNVSDEGLAITENGGNWTLRVIAPDGWWVNDGLHNFNLDIFVDGKLQSAFGDDERGRLIKEGILKTDGIIDFQIYVRDEQGDGKPNYEWRQNRYPLPEDPQVSGHGRTQIIINTENDELLFQEGLFWPYLSRQVGSYNNFHPKLPPIQIDWETSSIAHVAEFVALRMYAGTFNIYSKYRVHEGQINTVDFENPFAFYDLSGANDGTPEMNIRFGHTLPNDNVAYGANQTPLNDIQYVWDQFNQGKWDYQVALSGRHEITEVIGLPEFAIHTVPYEDLPDWIVNREWDIAAFVQVEREGYYNSEIVREWPTNRGGGAHQWLYLSGLRDNEPLDDFSKIAVGMRGEYAFEYDAQPYMYFSPIDRKLHLLGADGGIFNLDDQQHIHYHTLGGEYINLWSLMDQNQHLQSLYAGEDHLVYWDAEVVKIKRASLTPALFTSLPPTDQQSWAELGAKLSEYEPDFAPDDFSTMLAQFGGVEMEITSGSARALRPTPYGFRFVLSLMPDFEVQGPDLLGLAATPPGDYLVAYDGAFHLQSLTPPHLQFQLDPAQVDRLAAYTSTHLPLQVTNTGLEDAHDVSLTTHLLGPQGEMVEGEPQNLAVLAGETRTARLPFTPENPGDWRLIVSAALEDGTTFDQALALQVGPAPDTLPGQDLSAFGLIQPWQLAGLTLLLGLAAALALAFFSQEVLTQPDHEN